MNITTSHLTLLLTNAVLGGFALAWALTERIDGGSGKLSFALAAINFAAIAIALV